MLSLDTGRIEIWYVVVVGVSVIDTLKTLCPHRFAAAPQSWVRLLSLASTDAFLDLEVLRLRYADRHAPI